MTSLTTTAVRAIALLLLPFSSVWAVCSPIVIDLGNDGIDLGAAGVGVYFDVNGDYMPDHVQWVRPRGDEAFLAFDRNANGVIDNGTELFGVGTPMALEGGSAPNGFVGLAQYDQPAMGGNDDGVITNADAIWRRLSLWHDANADGISTRTEMMTLQAAGIRVLETIPKLRKYRDAAGNIIPYWARATGAGSKQLRMVDVFFLELEERASSLCTTPADPVRTQAG